MIKINLKESETLDQLLKRFKKQVKQAGILDDVKKHQYFLSKSLKRKEKAKRAKISKLKK